MPRSVTVIAATVGAVFALGAQQRVELPAPRPHPEAARPTMSALEPVIPAPREDVPAVIDPARFAVPGEVTGRAIAGAHLSGTASVRALDAVAGRSGFVVPAARPAT
jgi:hypothetical protein